MSLANDPPPAPGADTGFRPAAIAIRDRAPSATGRWLMRAVFLLLAVLLAWAVAGRVDVVAVAAGRVIPDGRSKVVQSPDGGVVSALHVREGQPVRQGQLMLEIDGAELRLESRRIGDELQAERLALAGALALWRLLDAPVAMLPASLLEEAFVEAGIVPGPRQRELQARLLDSRAREFGRRQDALLRRHEARLAEQRSLAASLLKLERSLPILNERAESARQLQARGLMARQQWLQQDLERIAMEQELVALRERSQGLTGEIAEIAAERAAQAAVALRDALLAVESGRRRTAGLVQQLGQLTERLSRLRLRAPVDGTVQELSVRAAGAVLRPAEPLLVLVPREARLEVEAFVLNRDIGFVSSGQAVAVKVDTFEFTRYGLLPARIRSVSVEAVDHPRLGAVYPARVALERDYFDREGKRTRIAPGMSVQVEIKTGSRKIIDYFLSPLGRAAHDSIRER